MQFSLAPQAEAAGYALLAFPSIGSTNSEALDRAREGTPGPLWVVSPHQRSGRGRRGRAWEGPPGNLAASLLLDVDCDPAMAATLGFVAGLAVYRAVESSVPALACGGNLKLKWPNDLLIDGAKLVGILLESEILPGGRRIVVIGIGINVVTAPGDASFRAAALSSLQPGLTAASLFETLSATWLACHAQWRNGEGMGAIRREWLAHAAGVGQPVAVTSGGETIRGVFETIDDTGQLIILRPDGSRHPITAGEVHFGTAATFKGSPE